MHDQALMRRRHRGADIHEEAQTAPRVETATPAVVVDRFAGDMFHHDVGGALAGQAGVVELGDVGMDELGEDLLLPQ